MKRIKLNDNWVLREASRAVDRVRNEFSASLAIEPVFGVEYSAAVAAAQTKGSFQVSEAVNSRLWDMCKDSTQQEFVVLMYNFLAYYYPTVLEYYAWQEANAYEKVENPIPNGDPITRLVPFAKQAIIDELKAEGILGTSDFMLLKELSDRGIIKVTLEDY